MPRMLSFLVAMVLVIGCSQAAINKELQKRSSPYLDCPAEQVQITNYEQGTAGLTPSKWDASGCGNRRFCRSWAGKDGYNVECQEPGK